MNDLSNVVSLTDGARSSSLTGGQDLVKGQLVLDQNNQTTLAPANTTAHLSNLEAEQALIGAILLNNRNLEYVSEFLKDYHFAHGLHGQIYHAICQLHDRGSTADPITLRDYFAHNDALKDLGGAKYLMQLAGNVLSTINVSDYGQLIFELYLRRNLLSIGEEVIQDARTHTLAVSAIRQIEIAEKKLYDLATKGDIKSGFQTFSNALATAIEQAEKAFQRDSHIVGVTSGFLDVDKMLGGLHPSDLLILAGRPSMGKTALATNIAFNAAIAYLKKGDGGAPVAFFSLEMSAEQLAGRILASESSISSDRIRRGDIKSSDFPAIVQASRQCEAAPLFIDDTPALSLTGIRNRSRRLQRQHGLGLIVIDYLQLIGTDDRKGAENRVNEISEITRGLKALAKELNVPVLALSQLSRAVEQRDDKRPQLSDLRESGSIEQDADVVMFVFREEYYEARKIPPEGSDKHEEWKMKMDKIKNVAELIVAKQRHGPIGTVKLFFDGALTKFANLDLNH